MKIIKNIFLLVIMGCTASQEHTQVSKKSNWPQSGVAYEIFVQSFYDSNGDSIGDIPGMTSKLDYVSELGANAIWLMPIMESPSYHKYDVTDYRSIHPGYGTMDDFKAFIKEAHQRDIKVIIDLIINHTSSKHPWFLDAKSGPDAQYRDYYVWADKDSIAEQIAKKETSFDSDNIRQWHAVDGDTTAAHYYGFFYGGMPDLNFDNEAVRQEVYEIGKFWLQEVGVDGFRMDAAKHIYPDDRPKDNHAFWAEFKSEMEKVNPDVYIVGEVWANTAIQTPFTKGFTSLFDFDQAHSILESIKNGVPANASIDDQERKTDSTASFISNIITNKQAYNEVNPAYVNAIFLSNHDQNRVMSVLDNDVNKAKLAASILLTLPGTPYIYYGEEIGMKGMKPDPNIREPFLWDDATNDTGRAKWISPEFTTDETVSPLVQQQEDKESIFNHYKTLIATRKANDVLATGNIEEIKVENGHILSFKRSEEDKEIWVLHNLSEEAQTVDIDNYKTVILGAEGWINEGALTLPALQSVVIQL